MKIILNKRKFTELSTPKLVFGVKPSGELHLYRSLITVLTGGKIYVDDKDRFLKNNYLRALLGKVLSAIGEIKENVEVVVTTDKPRIFILTRDMPAVILTKLSRNIDECYWKLAAEVVWNGKKYICIQPHTESVLICIES